MIREIIGKFAAKVEIFMWNDKSDRVNQDKEIRNFCSEILTNGTTE